MTALKSGDFVVLTGNSAFAGKIARVLCRAPDADFALPDGRPHIGCSVGEWVLEFPQKVAALHRGSDKPCMTKYLCSPECQLQPLGKATGLNSLFSPELPSLQSALLV